MDFYKQYPSGLRLVAKKMECYTVSLGVFVGVGSAYETADNNGFSHFVEHMLFKGTERRTAQQISEEADAIGATINAFTAKENTCFYTKSAATDLEKCFDILSDMYFFATFPQDELDRERGVVLEEIAMCEDNPDDVISDLLFESLFKNQQFGQTILGISNNIRYCDRHSIKKFKETHYIPQNTVIAVAGSFDFEQLDKLVEKYFESNCSVVETAVPELVKPNYTSEFLHKFKDFEQSHLDLVFPGGTSSSPDRYSITALSTILGGGMSSRLFQSLREKYGLVYSVYCGPSYYSNCGFTEIYAGFNRANIVKVVDLIVQEIDNLLTCGVLEKEVERARAQAVNGLYMAVENSMTYMRFYGNTMLKENKLFCLEDSLQGHRNVTVESVNQVARKMLNGPFASVYVGRETDNFDYISKFRK